MTAATCVALAVVGLASASASAATAKRIDLNELRLGTATFWDRPAHTSRRLAASSRSSWWGGTYYTASNDPVRVSVSDLYAYDPGYPQSVVNFLGALTHGSELPRVTLWIAPADLVA